MDEHEELEALLGAYVLGAVPPNELARTRAHILTCDECMAEADELSKAVESLSLTVEPVTPPPGFARQMLDGGAQERSSVTTPAPRSRWQRWLMVSYAAGLILAAVMGGVALDFRRGAKADQRVATALLESADGIELRGAGGVTGKVVPGEAGAVFVARGLDDLPNDRTYQLWLMRGRVPVSAGTFEVSDGVAVLRTARSPRAFDGAAVTIGPSGGTAQPTSDPVIKSA